MKTKFCYIQSIIFLILVSGCVRNEYTGELVIKEKMLFPAYTETGANTKTLLDGEVGDLERYIKWNPKDSIGISSGDKFEKFINISPDSSGLGLFEGYIEFSQTYYAVYPYNKDFILEGSLLTLKLPETQKYQINSFGSDCFPMISKKELKNDFHFMNLCGILVLRMKGDFTVKSIIFSAKDESGKYVNVSGKATVDMSYVKEPEMIMTENALPAVTLDCGEGVVLNETESVPFHIVLPVGEYNTFRIEVISVDGNKYIKEGSKPLTIKRSIATKTGEFVPDIVSIDIDATNLSKVGTANTYIVSSAAVYAFDASVIGNGVVGLFSSCHTDTPSIEPVSATLLWEDKESLITNIMYHPELKMISFFASGEEGNAVIAAKDAEGTILWSWHIWSTDLPQDQQYVNSVGAFYVMDRNIGATRADRGIGDEWKESMGTLYFWGRKDPFNGKNHERINKATFTIEETIKNPNLTHTTEGWSGYNSSWMEVHNKKAWSKYHKTIYDPCPIGYKVAHNLIWEGFTTTSQDSEDIKEFNVDGEFDNGWHFYLDPDKTSTAWYPITHSYGWGGWYDSFSDDWNKIWTTNVNNEEDPIHSTDAYVFSYTNTAIKLWGSAYNGEAHPVRCMKDGLSVGISLPFISITEITDITSRGATILANVQDEGNSAVIDRGVVIGNTPALTIETGAKYSNGTGDGEFSVDLMDLTSLTRYYVRAYATNADGTSYSQVSSFTTEYEGEAINLSVAGTANSYIVTDSARDFIFDASVKGNSTELVGTPASAEVLWETKNTDESVSKGDIISSVSLMDGGFVQFSIPTEYTPGNALIAVKDADGVILWSWHIWVADFDPVTTQQTYQSGAVMMDRNMGALNVQENDPRAYGLLYQWGRKDPMGGVATSNSFVKTYPDGIFTRESTSSINESIQNPIDFGSTSSWCGDNTLWQSEKSKYDPCPVGWRVPDGGSDGAWSGFGAYSQDVTNGAYFDTPYSTPRAFYPRGGYAYFGDLKVYFHGSTSYHWSCTPNGSNVYDFQLWQGQGLPTDSRDKSSLFNVRCQKDEAQSTVSIPAVQIKEVKDVTQDGVTVVSEVVRDGRSSVIEKGILVGETPDLTIDNALKVVKSESAEKEFTLTVNDLLDGTKYYVRSYAKNSAGIGYSEARSFTTVYSGNVRDLSANGTANSYIVNKYGIYSFNATVKGNTTTPLEATPVSAEVLWETRNTAESITVGCVVKDVTFENGRVKFSTSDDVTPGNALIAVKDADGYILWSWHIWVVDYNPGVQYHTYPSGAVMMDRDLGALSNGTDGQSNGLLYQWGRKDPFMAPVGNSMCATTAPESAIKYEKSSAAKGTLEYVETIPTTMLYNNNSRQDWLYARDHTLWGADKTMYDPCPKGWKVPDRSYGVWDNLSSVHYSTTGYSIDNTNAEFGNDYWTSISLENNERAYSKNGDRGKVSPARVRCVMESGLDIQIETIASEDKSVNVVSSVSSIAAEKIKEWGVLCSTSNTNLLITSDDVFKSADGEAGKSFGKFELSLDGLNPNSTYYLRVYVVSERGIEYSDIQTFQTKVSGDNEDFGDEDYEW